MMDRPSTSQHVEKIEMYEVREHVPYQAELTRAPTTTDGGSVEGYNASWQSAWNAICQLFNMIHHMIIGVVVFCLWDFALTVSQNGSISNLQLHIIFAGTGYQLFLVEAILTLHKHNSWSFQMSLDSKRIVHGCLQLIGSIFVIAGTFLALAETNMTISSAHGICGIIAFSFTVISFISGIVTLFSSKVRLLIKTGPVKVLHIAVGLFAIIGGLLSITLGFNMEYYSVGREGLAKALMTFVIFVLTYVLVQPIIDLIATAKTLL